MKTVSGLLRANVWNLYHGGEESFLDACRAILLSPFSPLLKLCWDSITYKLRSSQSAGLLKPLPTKLTGVITLGLLSVTTHCALPYISGTSTLGSVLCLCDAWHNEVVTSDWDPIQLLLASIKSMHIYACLWYLCMCAYICVYYARKHIILHIKCWKMLVFLWASFKNLHFWGNCDCFNDF